MRPSPHGKPQAATGQGPWPRAAVYRFADEVEPVLIVGLAGDDEVRILSRSGRIQTVGQHRVVVLDAAELIEGAA